MSTRDQMLASIKANQPDTLPLPTQFTFVSHFPDLTRQFIDILTFVGGTGILLPDIDAVKAHVQEQYAGMSSVATTVPALESLADMTLDVADPHELAGLNLAIIEGTVTVAENAAIWVDERQLPQRVVPMITQQLVTYHPPVGHCAQYARCLQAVTGRCYRIWYVHLMPPGFGTFICGPSKTATIDIEQSLVIGAHGLPAHCWYAFFPER